jgi:2-(1,2-epoxy-1,2-dihydrophenyl)acetyl-CoA isomerase
VETVPDKGEGHHRPEDGGDDGGEQPDLDAAAQSGAHEALGIVNRVVPEAELDDFVADWAERLASGPPLALQFSKRMLANSMSLSMAEALDAEASAQSVNLGSKDIREGIRAFLEKRPPKFQGH